MAQLGGSLDELLAAVRTEMDDPAVAAALDRIGRFARANYAGTALYVHSQRRANRAALLADARAMRVEEIMSRLGCTLKHAKKIKRESFD